MAQMKRDLEFLKAKEKIDYSLLVGVHRLVRRQPNLSKTASRASKLDVAATKGGD